jgi:hypothetical protein
MADSTFHYLEVFRSHASEGYVRWTRREVRRDSMRIGDHLLPSRAKSREQRAESREQRAESREQRAESREQRAESREQRAESRECGALRRWADGSTFTLRSQTYSRTPRLAVSVGWRSWHISHSTETSPRYCSRHPVLATERIGLHAPRGSSGCARHQTQLSCTSKHEITCGGACHEKVKYESQIRPNSQQEFAFLRLKPNWMR